MGLRSSEQVLSNMKEDFKVNIQDLVNVMGVASIQLSGKTEGRLISEKVKHLLSQ